jgi:recombination protein RecA
MVVRAHLESLLKARKLDVTLTSASPWDITRLVADDFAATGVPSVDAALGGGFRRGHLSEIVGPRSSGRTGVMCQALAAAASRGELVALVDTCDRFDPESASAAGLDLSRLLWIRETGDLPRALKAMNLVLQAGGFGVVVLDLADVTGAALRTLPFTTWFRLARVIEGSQTVALVMASEHLARSSGGATIALGDDPEMKAPAGAHRAIWIGRSNRARLLGGLELKPRVIGVRSGSQP